MSDHFLQAISLLGFGERGAGYRRCIPLPCSDRRHKAENDFQFEFSPFSSFGQPMQLPPLSVVSQSNIFRCQDTPRRPARTQRYPDRSQLRELPHFVMVSRQSPTRFSLPGGCAGILCHTGATRANHISRYETKVTSCED